MESEVMTEARALPTASTFFPQPSLSLYLHVGTIVRTYCRNTPQVIESVGNIGIYMNFI